MSSRLRTAVGRGKSMRSGFLTLLTRKVQEEAVAGALLEFVISLDLRRGIIVQETLTLRGVQNLKEEDQSQRRVMEVM